jgi:hypothetical protein
VYPKCVKTHLRAFVISKFFSGGYTPGPPFQGEGREGWGGRGGERGGKGRGREGERKDWALLVFGPFRRPWQRCSPRD